MSRSPCLYDQETARYQRSAKWELQAVKKALGLHSFLNTPEENARLQAVTDILKSRRKSSV